MIFHCELDGTIIDIADYNCNHCGASLGYCKGKKHYVCIEENSIEGDHSKCPTCVAKMTYGERIKNKISWEDVQALKKKYDVDVI